MTTDTRTLNDVNLDAVAGLAAAITTDPVVADTIWKSSVQWKGGFRSESQSRDFAPVPSDEPVGLGGEDTAPNPVEQLLGALGNCLAVGYAANASAAGIELKDLRIELEGDLDLHSFLGLKEGHAGYQSISAKVTLESDTTADQLEELHRKVLDTSPVGHTLQREIPVQITLS